MRFSFGCSVIASILASVSLVGTVESVSVLRGNDGLKQTLMKNAVPVDMVEGKPILPNQQHQQSSIQEKGQARRKVEEDKEEERFEITGDYTIQFNSCISLKTGPSYENGNGDDGGNGDILFNSDLIGYTQGGKIVNEKSFVLFNVCKTEYCSYYNQDTASTYMIDINAYMQALTQYYLDEQQKFCASCYYNYEYCEYVKEQEAKYAQYYKTNSKYDQASMADSQYAGTGYKAAEGSSYQNANYYSSNGDNQQEDGDNSYQQANQYQSSQSGNGGNRKLAVDMSGYKLLNCSKCDEMLCGVNVYDDQQQNQGGDQQQEVDDAWVPQIDMESVAQWMDVMTECQQTSATLFDAGLYPLYSGFMCNADGTGIEIALFLDEECLTYTSLQSFNKVASAQYDLPYMDYVKQVLQFPIENDISCKADTVYVNNDLYTAISNGQTAYTNYAENGEEQEQDEDKQSESSEFCRDLFEGGEDGEAVSIKNCPEDGDQQQENQAYDENGDVITMYSDYTYDWYTYVVTQENARESRNVCPIVAAMHGEYTYIYEEGGSGSLYKETTATASGGSSSSIVTHYAQMASEKLTPMIIAIISAVVLLATAAFCCILYSCCCKSSIPNQFTEQTEGVRQRRHGSVTNDGGESKRERLVDATTGKLA